MALEAAAAAKTTKTGLGSCIVNFLAVQKVVLFIILALKTSLKVERAHFWARAEPEN